MARNTPPSLISYTEIPYNVTTTPRTSASISWLTGDVIVVLAGDEGSSVITAPTVTGLTFAAQKTNTVNCETGVWTAVAGSSGSGGITSGRGATVANWGASIWVWRGSDGVGVSFEQHTTTKTVSATPTDTHSAFMWGAFDFSATAVGTTVGTPTPTNTDESAQETVGSYSAFVYDLDDKASAAAVGFGVSGGTSVGVFSIIGVEVLGTTTSSLVYPPGNRRESTRNRAFFAIRRKPWIPVSSPDFLPQWRAPETPPLSHARLAAALRGHRSFVVPPQVPVPKPVFGNRISTARGKLLAVRRGRQTNPVLTQTGAVAPTWVPQRIPPRRLIGATGRGKRTLVLSDQAAPRQYRASRLRLATPTRGKRTSVTTDHVGFPRQSRAAKPKLPGSRRGRQWSAATMAQPVVTVTWPPPKLGSPRRLLGSQTRGRRSFPTPAQIPVPIWPPSIQRSKPRPAMLRRGHRNDPPWTITAPIAPKFVPQSSRTRPRVAFVRRGRRFDPAWSITIAPGQPPTICYPTTALIVGYASGTSFVPNASATTIRSYSSTTTIPDRSTSMTAIAPYGSAAAPGVFPLRYASTVMSDGPASYYQLDDTTTTAVDQMGADNGTYSGTYSQSAPGAIVGDPDTAVAFTSGQILLAANPLAVGSVSVEMWFKTTAVTAGLFDMRPSVGANRAVVIRYVSNVLSVFMGNGTVNPSVTPSGVWNDGAWHHLVATYDTATIRVFIDGALRGSTALAGPISYGTTPVPLLANDSGSRHLVGSLDEIAFYDYQLSAAQILNHYAAGATPDSTYPTAGAMVGYQSGVTHLNTCND